MKGVELFCASQAATSVCLSMEHTSSSSSAASPSTTTTLLGGGRAIDRHNPILKDSKRTTPKPPPPSKPQKPHPRNKKNSTENESATFPASFAAAIARKSWSCTNPGEFLSPPGSTRYLLREKVYYNSSSPTLSDSDPTKICIEDSENKQEEEEEEDPLPEQIVVVRVSLHCRGCEKKLRKHLSRMEGIKSFDIDFLAKKVTVVGNVVAPDVVSSISKVMRNAQLWSPILSSESNNRDEKNNNNNNSNKIGALV